MEQVNFDGEYRPCPFCGSTDIHEGIDAIRCGNCEAEGPFNSNCDWNKRVNMPQTSHWFTGAIIRLCNCEGPQLKTYTDGTDEYANCKQCNSIWKRVKDHFVKQ